MVLCEKEEDLLSGASSGNSGHVASNFYYSSSRAPLEAELSARARIINKQWIDSQPAVPCSRKTMLYLARGEEEEASLRNIMELGKMNNVAGIRKVSLAEVEELEPHLCMDGITGALLSDNEAIVDPWLLAMTHVYGMEVAGVDILTGCEVLGMTRDQGRWSVNTVKGTMMARVVVNCGGNHGDKVEEMLEQVITSAITISLTNIVSGVTLHHSAWEGRVYSVPTLTCSQACSTCARQAECWAVCLHYSIWSYCGGSY